MSSTLKIGRGVLWSVAFLALGFLLLFIGRLLFGANQHGDSRFSYFIPFALADAPLGEDPGVGGGGDGGSGGGYSDGGAGAAAGDSSGDY